MRKVTLAIEMPESLARAIQAAETESPGFVANALTYVTMRKALLGSLQSVPRAPEGIGRRVPGVPA